MKVQNMKSAKGNSISNQFIIEDATYTRFIPDNGFSTYIGDFFQSYESIIAFKSKGCSKGIVLLDKETWDYSVTTGKYRNIFLGEKKAETERKIESGEYKLVNLN